MNIGLLGYGKMGKMIESLVKKNNAHQISIIITSKNISSLTADDFKSTDVVIDFSVPDAVFENAEKTLSFGKPMVIGTTGWYDRMDDLKNICKKYDGCLVYGSNFSTGVNLFFLLNDFLADLMKSRKKYLVEISETHHIHKKDSPSGTAITLAESILKKREWLKQWINESSDILLPVISKREGEVIGDHEVKYISSNDSIEIRHHAFNREGFAQGAVNAAEWALGKNGFYSFREILSDII